ncbi:MAG: DNA recombination/repair protein RecA, partial [Patescibacteria group bacterium]
TGTTVIFTNLIRMILFIMFGNPETTPGGNALKFFSSVRMDIRRIAQLKNKDEIVGNRVRVKVVKNKVAAPFKQAEFDIMYNQGVASLADVLQTGVRLGVLEKSGSWFQYGSQKIGQGTEASVSYLKENPKVSADILQNIKKKSAESQVV